jgi:hypothetical protein
MQLAVLWNHYSPKRALTTKQEIRKYLFEMLKSPTGCLTYIDKETKERNYLRMEDWSERHPSHFGESMLAHKMIQDSRDHEKPLEETFRSQEWTPCLSFNERSLPPHRESHAGLEPAKVRFGVSNYLLRAFTWFRIQRLLKDSVEELFHRRCQIRHSTLHVRGQIPIGVSPKTSALPLSHIA